MLSKIFVYNPMCLSLRTTFSKFCLCLVFFCCYFSRLDSGYLELHSGCWYCLDVFRSGFFLQVGLVHDIEYFPLQTVRASTGIYIKRGVKFKYTYHVNFRNVLPFYLICRWRKCACSLLSRFSFAAAGR